MERLGGMALAAAMASSCCKARKTAMRWSLVIGTATGPGDGSGVEDDGSFALFGFTLP